MMLPEEIVAQRCDDAIATCTEAINILDLAEGDMLNLIRSLSFDHADLALRLTKHLKVNLKSQEAFVNVRGNIHAAIHTMPDSKVVHLTEEVF